MQLSDIIRFCEHPRRTETKITEIGHVSALDEDVNQQFHLNILELLHEKGISYDTCSYDAATGRWVYPDQIEAYVDEALDRMESKPSRSSTDFLWLLMRDAMRDMRKLNDLTVRRKQVRESWEVELTRLHDAMSTGADGMPATTRRLDTYAELSDALTGNLAKEYELSDTAAYVLHMFQHGTTAERRAILLMVQAAIHLERGEDVPQSLKQKLKRARKDVSGLGWQLKTTLLK